MGYKEYHERIKKLNNNELKNEIKNIRIKIKKEENKSKIKKDYLKYLSLKAQYESLNFEELKRKNDEYTEQQNKRKKMLR